MPFQPSSMANHEFHSTGAEIIDTSTKLPFPSRQQKRKDALSVSASSTDSELPRAIPTRYAQEPACASSGKQADESAARQIVADATSPVDTIGYSNQKSDHDIGLQSNDESVDPQLENSTEYLPWLASGSTPSLMGNIGRFLHKWYIRWGFVFIVIKLIVNPHVMRIWKFISTWGLFLYAANDFLLPVFAGLGMFQLGPMSKSSDLPLNLVLCLPFITNVNDGMIADAWDSAAPTYIFSNQIPVSFQQCENRVTTQQAPLFQPAIYATQFTLPPMRGEIQQFNTTRYQAVRTNMTLCDQGFVGNSDLYGLGVRVGIYLQWLSSLIANHLLADDKTRLRTLYLGFTVILCITTFLLTFTKSCVFATEIEILYWMFWGGSLCVFASAPGSVQLGSRATWIGLDRNFAVLSVLFVLMFNHGIWFMWYAYDHVFARLPCGTYHFVLAPVLNPSKDFWDLQKLTMSITAAFYIPICITVTLVIILISPEITASIQASSIYQTLFRTPIPDDADQSHSLHIASHRQISTNSSLRQPAYTKFDMFHQKLRTNFGLPVHARLGVRFITPVLLTERRKYRAQYAALGIVSIVLSITAIELTLKWNRVQDINSLISMGQTIPLMLGVVTFLGVCWQLIVQECKRIRDARRPVLTQTDGVKLQPV